MSDIVKGNLGNVGAYDVSWSAGKLSVSMSAADGAISGQMGISVDAKVAVDALFAKLPKNLLTVEIQAAFDAAISS